MQFVMGERPPTLKDVVYRSAALGSLLMRAFYEDAAVRLHRSGVKEWSAQQVADLQGWMAQEDLAARQSPRERVLFNQPIGSWQREQHDEVTWRTEALGALLWAASLESAIPAYDTLFPMSVVGRVGVKKSLAEVFGRAVLRPQDELERAWTTSELWFWPAWSARRESVGVIRSAAEAAASRRLLPPLIDGDFPAFHQSFAQLGQAERQQILSTAMERRHAFRWICGVSPSWDARAGED